MNPTQLARVLELMAQALRQVPPDALTDLAVAAQPGQPTQQLPAMPVAMHPQSSPTAAQPTLADWLDAHMARVEARGYKTQTLRNRRANVAHIRRLWGHYAMRALKPSHITKALQAEFIPGRVGTAKRVLGELREAYTDAIADDWCEANPALAVRLPRAPIKRKRLTFPTWQAMRVLSSTSPQRWVEPMLLLALVTGQRRSDLAAMRWTDIITTDDGVQVLRIEQLKKAGKPIGARVEIPLNLRLDAIGMTVSDVIERCRACGKPGDTLLRQAGGRRIEVSSLSARFHEHLQAVAPGAYAARECPSLHEVRSLSGRLYHAQGIDVQTLLGHSHREMTELYLDERDIGVGKWRRVQPAAKQTHAAHEPQS